MWLCSSVYTTLSQPFVTRLDLAGSYMGHAGVPLRTGA